MMVASEVQKELRDHFASAVAQAIHKLEAHRTAGAKFPEESGVLSMCMESNGMPSFYRSFESVTDYHRTLGELEEPFIEEQTEHLIEFVGSHECLSKVFIDFEGAPDGDEARRSRLEMSVSGLLTEIVGRYAGVFGTGAFTDAHFDQIWNPRATYCFSADLPFHLVVPILFTRFDFDHVQIAPQIAVQRMDEEMQLARAALLDNEKHSAEEYVAACATHAFVVEGLRWSSSHPRHACPIHEMFRGSAEEPELPIDVVDKCFAALRVVAGVDTGYAQVVRKPIGWANMTWGTSMPLCGYSIAQYPPHFNHGYWCNQHFPCVSANETACIGSVLTALISNSSKALALAMARLNLCSNRFSSDDMLLDAAIGLEAALCSDSRSEMTYKLALRLGGISGLSRKCQISPSEVFKNVKALYGERSTVAHGASSKKQYTRLQTPSGDRQPAPMAARDYLRLAILILCEYPQYLSPKKIDEDLLLGVIAGKAKRLKKGHTSDST